MPLSDVLQAAMSRPVARIIDSPVRALMNEILEDYGYASPEAVEALRRELAEAEALLHRQTSRLEELEKMAQALQVQMTSLRA